MSVKTMVGEGHSLEVVHNQELACDVSMRPSLKCTILRA